MKVIILYGGKSGEHEVSILSAASVIENINKKYELELIGIDKKGIWHLQDKKTVTACKNTGKLILDSSCPEVLTIPGKGLFYQENLQLKKIDFDMIFPVIHGTFCEDGTIQGLLECISAPYVGADVLGSSIGMEKDLAKEIWRSQGLPVIPEICIKSNDDEAIKKASLEAINKFPWPIFVKPVACGSSVGASKATNMEELYVSIKEALKYDTKALIEPFIDAREIECSVLGNDEPIAFAPGELITTHSFYDYDAKYIDPEGASFVIPAQNLDTEAVKDIAIKAYKAAHLSGMARVDFFINKKDNCLYLNEVNTIPGFTSISMYPKMCKAGGLSFTELIEKLIKLALERKEKKDSVLYNLV